MLSSGRASPKSKRLARLLRIAVLLAAVAIVVGVYLAEFGRVKGRSMEPTLRDGDRVVFEKVSSRWGGPVRFDVLVFKGPNDPDKVLIKRVVGLPDEMIEIRAGRLLVNGVHASLPPSLDWGDVDFGPVAVSPAHYFVLGDNMGDSDDSRRWGGVPRDYVLGRVCWRFWPLVAWKVFARERRT